MANGMIVLDGDQIDNLSTFYDEVENKLTRDLGWSMGRNLDAFNDVLRGGFGVHDYDEPIQLIWQHSGKSSVALGWEETVIYFQAMLTTCHPANVEMVGGQLAKSEGWRTPAAI
jgi:RNAse (barnase) inhibitor barstar